MPNNFKLGTPGSSLYLAKVGSGSATTSPDTPGVIPTPPGTTSATAGSYIVGAGVYEQAFTLRSAGITSAFYTGDGRVVFIPTAVVDLTKGDGSNGTFFTGIWWNLNNQTMTYSIGSTNNGFTDCVVQNGTINYSGGASATLINLRTVFNNIVYTCTITGNRSFDYCQIYNSTFTLVTSATIPMSNTYVDEATTITWQAFGAQAIAGGFKNNNFRGKIVVATVAYELKKDKNLDWIPSRADGMGVPNNGIADLDTLFGGTGTCYTTYKNFAQDAEFANLSKFDFRSVASTSPNLYADTTGLLHIGNVLVATPLKATDAGFATGDISNLTVTGNDFTVTAGTSGTATSIAIQVAPIPQVVGTVLFGKLDAFDSSVAKGTAKNNNVTAVLNYGAGTAGANPRRLTYEMRWSTKTTTPTLDADWDNNGYVTAGDYLIFECSTQPRVDTAGYGNGSPEFSNSGSALIQAKWVQYRITVRNGLGLL